MSEGRAVPAGVSSTRKAAYARIPLFSPGTITAPKDPSRNVAIAMYPRQPSRRPLITTLDARVKPIRDSRGPPLHIERVNFVSQRAKKWDRPSVLETEFLSEKVSATDTARVKENYQVSDILRSPATDSSKQQCSLNLFKREVFHNSESCSTNPQSARGGEGKDETLTESYLHLCSKIVDRDQEDNTGSISESEQEDDGFVYVKAGDGEEVFLNLPRRLGYNALRSLRSLIPCGPKRNA